EDPVARTRIVSDRQLRAEALPAGTQCERNRQGAGPCEGTDLEFFADAADRAAALGQIDLRGSEWRSGAAGLGLLCASGLLILYLFASSGRRFSAFPSAAARRCVLAQQVRTRDRLHVTPEYKGSVVVSSIGLERSYVDLLDAVVEFRPFRA